MAEPTAEMLEELKAKTLENLRHDIENIGDEGDLSSVKGYYLGRLTLLCSLDVMTEEEYIAVYNELLTVIDAECAARERPVAL
jgi:hypothetical protein